MSSKGTTSDSISSEMERILRVAGIDSAPIDPSSTKCLRELIACELEKKQSDCNSQGEEASPFRMGNNVKSDKPTVTNVALSHNNKEAAKVLGLPKPPSPPVDTVAGNKQSTMSSLDAASRKLSKIPNFAASHESKDETTVASTSLMNQLSSQQKTLEEQSEALKLLTNHIQELTNAVHSLHQTVETLQGSQAPIRMQNHFASDAQTPAAPMGAPIIIPPRDPNATENDPNENTHANTNDLRQQNANEFQRAHLLAHHVAWRIATFPVRAIFFYLKYEYRIWLVMYRLARRDVLNPFREAGMMFQLFFALIIVYSRIAPALERAVNQRKREQEQGGGSEHSEDDYYDYGYDEAFLEDAEFQIQTIVAAILAGFLYHVGVFGLGYRFFFRDRLHVRIWNDLREGVELTPTYGLEFDRDEAPATDENENENNQENIGNNNENNNMDQAGRANNNNENNNNAPPPPNRNRNVPNGNRGNDNDNGPLVDIANAIGNGVNDFFMGHGRRRRAAQEQAAAALAAADAREPAHAETEDDVDGPMDFENADANATFENPDYRNPVIGLLSDIVCLFYSFFVSILPGWNYEQQLRNLRDEDDMRLRAIMEREAEALRNQNVDDNDDDTSSGSESETESDSD